jgi:hypothetical protein
MIKLHRWNPFRIFYIDNGTVLCKFVPMLFKKGGGGGGGNTTSTVNQNNIPPELMPYVESMLGEATNQIFDTKLNPKTGKYDITGIKGYTPYNTDPEAYVAGFAAPQQQAYHAAMGLQLPGQYAQATDFANAAGQGGLQSAQQTLGYGAQGARSGATGQQFGLQSAQNAQNMAQNYGALGAGYGQRAANIGEMALQAQDYGRQIGDQAQRYAAQSASAGQDYLNQISNQANVQQFMSPYQQAVTDQAKQAAMREFQVGQTYRQGNAAKSGAYGGARQAIENAEAQRNLNTQLQTLDVQGRQNAYNQAIANIGQGTQYGLSGLQGAQTGLNTALSGGQLGLSGIGQAISGQQVGIQGANTGLSGVGQYINAGNLGLAGTAQGMQGAELGLKGVQGAQAGYGLANTAGTNLANIGTAQQDAQLGIINQQANFGAQERQYYQDVINADIQNYANTQQYPLQQLGTYSALIRGTPLTDSTQTVYGTNPSVMSQLGGLAATGLGAYMAKSAKTGGVIDEPKKYKSGGIVDLAIAHAMGEA